MFSSINLQIIAKTCQEGLKWLCRVLGSLTCFCNHYYAQQSPRCDKIQIPMTKQTQYGIKRCVLFSVNTLIHPPNYHLFTGKMVLCRKKIANSLEPNNRWTSDQSVNLSLFVVVQQKITRELYLFPFTRGGLTTFKNTIYEIANLRFSAIFHKISKFKKKMKGMSLKARGLIFQILSLFIRI